MNASLTVVFIHGFNVMHFVELFCLKMHYCSDSFLHF